MYVIGHRIIKVNAILGYTGSRAEDTRVEISQSGTVEGDQSAETGSKDAQRGSGKHGQTESASCKRTGE